MRLQHNPYRGKGLPAFETGREAPDILDLDIDLDIDGARPLALLAHCPVAAATPLKTAPGLAAALGVGTIHLKDESGRMGLGSFKALGAAYVIAHEAAQAAGGVAALSSGKSMTSLLQGRVYACASAGNHGLSVAAGARVFGARAIIYLSDAVPESFAERLRRRGAQVVRAGTDYEASMARVEADAQEHGWTLLSDSSWPGYTALPTRIMEGYLVMAAEVIEQLGEPPDCIVLQAGVGGLAAAVAHLLRARWGDAPTIVVVEPETAPGLLESIRAGKWVKTLGPLSTMGRLDCKEPSYLALAELARTADIFVTITDAECEQTVRLLHTFDIATTPSGGAGVAAVQHAADHRARLGLDSDTRVLAFVTEGPETD